MTPHHPWIADAFPLARSYDTAGWFTRSAGDMRATMDAAARSAPSLRGEAGCWLELPGLDPEVAVTYRRAAAAIAPPADALGAAQLLEAFGTAAESYAVLGAREAWQIHAGWLDRVL